jgi:hypothetical protein
MKESVCDFQATTDLATRPWQLVGYSRPSLEPDPMRIPPLTPVHDLTGPELAERVTRLGWDLSANLSRGDWEVLTEAVRRLKQHEQLLREVVPDLRNRIGELEAAVALLLRPK